MNTDAKHNGHKPIKWRKEYIRVLEELENKKHNEKLTDAQRESFAYNDLLSELEGAGLVKVGRLSNSYIITDKRITYLGRLELDKLRREAWWRKLITWLYGVALVALGYFADIIHDVVLMVCSKIADRLI